MNCFTHETSDKLNKLEKYEWDNLWWEQTADKTAKRILYIGDSIDLSNQSRNELVIVRNNIAKGLAQKYQLPVIDLHTVAITHSECHVPDGVHFNASGYELLAKCILKHCCC